MFLITIVCANIIIYSALIIYSKLTCGINKCSKHLVGKVVIVTGANAGIGFETAKDLAERGAKVIIGCRSKQRGIEARNKIIEQTGNKDVHFKELDLASFKSVRAFAEDVLKTEKELHILINNAGIVGKEHKKTEDGLLLDMQANHFGPFLLTNLLIPLLKSSAPSRIVMVSSVAHVNGKIDFEDLNMEKGKYSSMKAYSNSKLCNVLMALELSKRLKGTGVTSYSLHPGGVNTEIIKDVWWAPIFWFLVNPIYKTPWQGAQTTLFVAVSNGVESLSGKYFSDCREKPASRTGQDGELAAKLWDVSERVTELK